MEEHKPRNQNTNQNQSSKSILKTRFLSISLSSMPSLSRSINKRWAEVWGSWRTGVVVGCDLLLGFWSGKEAGRDEEQWTQRRFFVFCISLKSKIEFYIFFLIQNFYLFMKRSTKEFYLEKYFFFLYKNDPTKYDVQCSHIQNCILCSMD